MLFSELSIDEVMETMKPRNPPNLMASGSGSGSGSASGYGSGQTEEEKEQHVEDAEDKDESKGKKLQQHEEDVKEAVFGEASKPKGSVDDLD